MEISLEAYGPRRGEAGALGGVSFIVRSRPEDFATPVLERRA